MTDKDTPSAAVPADDESISNNEPSTGSAQWTHAGGEAGPEREMASTSDSPESDSDEPRFERKWSKRPAASKPAPEIVAAAGSDDLAGDLEREKARADELFERLQRSMADLSNYRKRAESDREEMTKFANMVLVSQLLP